jgi:hypothetical protein
MQDFYKHVAIALLMMQPENFWDAQCVLGGKGNAFFLIRKTKMMRLPYFGK